MLIIIRYPNPNVFGEWAWTRMNLDRADKAE